VSVLERGHRRPVQEKELSAARRFSEAGDPKE
jgi:hypothetical protein